LHILTSVGVLFSPAKSENVKVNHIPKFSKYILHTQNCLQTLSLKAVAACFNCFHTEVWSTQPFLFTLQYQLCDMLLVVSLKC